MKLEKGDAKMQFGRLNKKKIEISKYVKKLEKP